MLFQITVEGYCQNFLGDSKNKKFIEIFRGIYQIIERPNGPKYNRFIFSKRRRKMLTSLSFSFISPFFTLLLTSFWMADFIFPFFSFCAVQKRSQLDLIGCPVLLGRRFDLNGFEKLSNRFSAASLSMPLL